MKINDLLKDIRRNPIQRARQTGAFEERFTGWWPRRITDEHRLVYRVTGKQGEQVIEVLQGRGHY